MDEKLLETGDIEIIPRGGRVLEIPAGLTEHDLLHLPVDEVQRRLKESGAAFGMAVMVKLAAGHGKTPSGVQFASAKFLIEQGITEIDKDKETGRDERMNILRNQSAEFLGELVKELEKKKQAAIVVQEI